MSYGFIVELNTDNNQHLCLPKIKEFLDLIRKTDQLKAKEMASYVVTVKAQYLIIVSLYYTYKKDKVRVQREWEEFNGDAKEILTVRTDIRGWTSWMADWIETETE
jgi:hypothetical protein